MYLFFNCICPNQGTCLQLSKLLYTYNQVHFYYGIVNYDEVTFCFLNYIQENLDPFIHTEAETCYKTTKPE